MRKSIKLFSLLAVIALTGAVSPALAQTAAATPAVTVNGMVDGYYAYNFTNSGVFTTSNAPGAYYFYNNMANNFALGLAEVKLTATQGQGSAHLVLADQPAGLISGLTNPGIDVLQAYASWNPSQWTISAGRFVSWMGYEVIESSSNWNYSRSLLFGYVPFWNTGVSVGYTPDSTFSITAYDTDTTINSQTSTPNGKTYGLAVAINPNSMWAINLNGIMVPLVGTANTQSNITAEGNVLYKASAEWNFALDVQFGTNTQPTGSTVSQSLFGAALYGKYQMQSDWSLAGRLEYVNDGQNNYIPTAKLYGNGAATGSGNGFSAMEATLTLEHDFTTNLIGRLEGRGDFASAAAGGNASNVFATSTTPSSSNLTGTASLAMTF